MAVLIIHPKDITTDFLVEGYRHTDYNVVNSNCSKSSLKRLITDHKQIIMLGHGGDIGLYGFKHMVIDSTYVYLLRQKPGSVYIWCNADKFAYKYDLKGFATGMIISDYEEAIDFGVRATSEEIDESNRLFAECIKQSIHLPAAEMYAKMKEFYKSETNPVVDFNKNNFYLFE